MTTINQDEYMKDRKGRLVPISQISDYDQAMDSFVREQVAAAKAKNAELSEFKDRAFNECYAWLDLVAEKFGRTRGGAKGNVTFPTFDGSQQITIRVQETLTFGPELQIAKELFDECVTDWSKGANANLQAIVTDAFQVDKEGQLNTGRILSLRRVKIQDERWIKAMDAISESLQVAMSKTYINFREKDKSGKLVNIPLDIAAI
ncbi:sulfate transporter [Klebsiella oxytoca]|nr:sulfate transporter [Klebsiella oxytoca]